MLTREAAGLQPTTKKYGRLDFGRVRGLVCTIAVSFGNSSFFSRWPPYWKAFEIPLKNFTVFSEYTYCWMFIFCYLLHFIISRRALAQEGDYEMLPVCACVS